jgi:hypothetical protein
MWKILWLLIFVANISPNVEQNIGIQESHYNQYIPVKEKSSHQFQLTLQIRPDLEENIILCEYIF